MRTNKNSRAANKARVSPVLALRKALSQHVRKHVVCYVPALAPLAFFLLAHGLTLCTLVLFRSGLLHQEQLVHKTLVTWAVYGFLPLLLCSYLGFFAVGRVAQAILERKYSHWSQKALTLTAGAAYGAAVGVCLLLLLAPDTWLNGLLVLLIGMAAGLGNWFFYRKLAIVDA